MEAKPQKQISTELLAKIFDLPPDEKLFNDILRVAGQVIAGKNYLWLTPEEVAGKIYEDLIKELGNKYSKGYDPKSFRLNGFLYTLSIRALYDEVKERANMQSIYSVIMAATKPDSEIWESPMTIQELIKAAVDKPAHRKFYRQLLTKPADETDSEFAGRLKISLRTFYRLRAHVHSEICKYVKAKGLLDQDD